MQQSPLMPANRAIKTSTRDLSARISWFNKNGLMFIKTIGHEWDSEFPAKISKQMVDLKVATAFNCFEVELKLRKLYESGRESL